MDLMGRKVGESSGKGKLGEWSDGVLEWWSDGFPENPILQYSITPILQLF
jgi:hypothetical protein